MSLLHSGVSWPGKVERLTSCIQSVFQYAELYPIGFAVTHSVNSSPCCLKAFVIVGRVRSEDEGHTVAGTDERSAGHGGST